MNYNHAQFFLIVVGELLDVFGSVYDSRLCLKWGELDSRSHVSFPD